MTCVLTVVSLMNSRSEISPFDSPVGDQAEDVELPRRQLVDGLGPHRTRQLRELLDHALGHRGRQQRVTGRDGAQRGDQLLRRIVLEDEAAGARLERLVDVLVEVEGGEDEDAGRRVGGEDVAGGLDAVELRHADVHEHHRRAEAGGLLDGLDAVGGFGDHVDVGLAREQQAEAGADHRLVVGDKDADGAHEPYPLSGRLVMSRKPPSAAAPVLISPP